VKQLPCNQAMAFNPIECRAPGRPHSLTYPARVAGTALPPKRLLASPAACPEGVESTSARLGRSPAEEEKC